MADKKVFKKKRVAVLDSDKKISKLALDKADTSAGKELLPKNSHRHLQTAFPEGMSSRKYEFAKIYVSNGFKVYDALRAMGFAEDALRHVAGEFTKDVKVTQFVAKVIAEEMEVIKLDANKIVSHLATIMLDPTTPKSEQIKAANLLMKHYNGYEEHQKAGKSSEYSNKELNERIKNLSNRLNGKQHGVKKIMDEIDNAEVVDFTDTYDEKEEKSEE